MDPALTNAVSPRSRRTAVWRAVAHFVCEDRAQFGARYGEERRHAEQDVPACRTEEPEAEPLLAPCVRVRDQDDLVDRRDLQRGPHFLDEVEELWRVAADELYPAGQRRGDRE